MKTKSSNEIEEILRQALSLYWLRPENGVAVAAYCIYGQDLLPSAGEAAADYACGDGINTFFKCGGRFDIRFDVFNRSVAQVNASQIVEDKIDVFDYYDDQYEPMIVQRPAVGYTYGTDHKKNLLKKSEKLEFYSELIEADLEEDTSIGAASMDLIYCNSIYWVGNPGRALSHMKSKLRKEGRVILDVFTKTKCFGDFKVKFPMAGLQWQEFMNRGRMENNPGLLSEAEWRRVFSEQGFEIVEERNILPAALFDFWNYGLRSMFPSLNRMVSHIPEDCIREVKEEWIDNWCRILLPVLCDPGSFSRDTTRYRTQYLLVNSSD